MARIAFVTCADLSRYFPSDENPLLTHDDQLAAAALMARGHRVQALVWGCEPRDIRAAGFDLLVLRSTWDYMDSPEKRAAFFDWILTCEQAGVAMENPPQLLRWNLDKHYLADLEQAGLPIVPTRFIEPGQSVDLLDLFEDMGPLVIKPCISAAAVDAHFIADPDQAESFEFDELRQDRAFLAQPFMDEILSEGEWSLVFMAGELVHAVLKRPAPGDWRVQDELGGTVLSAEAPPSMVKLAQRVMGHLPQIVGLTRPPLYARVDLLRQADAMVGELELIEPELFFLQRSPGANRPHRRTLESFCRAVEQRLP